ncbi:MAG: outer membrane protein assembly factor BamE [Alphaproteobacteria bacterium]|nr:MAG: outer membrane protein assembly factor BamE [Alphaproteobacteria bacterium]
MHRMNSNDRKNGNDRCRPAHGQFFVLALTLGTALLLSACSRGEDIHGYIFDDTVANAISPGVDNRRSVQDSLGSPSTTSDFGPEVWYYISRETKRKGFFKETAIDQKILAIAFDDGGTVKAVKHYTMADARRVRIRSDKTPVRGKTLSFFQQLFANIGRFAPGTGQNGPGGGRPPGT